MHMKRHLSSVQFSSVAQSSRLFATPWIAAHQAYLSITISRGSLRHTSIESVMPSSHLILGRPLLLLPPTPPPPASESFPMSQIFAWGGQSTGVSALASFPPKKSQGLYIVVYVNPRASQVALVGKNTPASKEDIAMGVQSLGWEDPLEEGMATHSSILAWRIPWTEGPGELQSMGLQRVRKDWSGLAPANVNLKLLIHLFPPFTIILFSVSVSLFLFCK